MELLLGPITELTVTGCPIKSMFHRTSQSDGEMVVVVRLREKWHFKTIFKFFNQLMRHPHIKLFHLSNLLQMLNNPQTLGVGFLAIFHVVVKRIIFDDALGCSLSPSVGQPLRFSSSRLSSPLQNFLSHTALYGR